MNLLDKFKKPYDATSTEERIYRLWEESGFFNPDKCIEASICTKDADTFSVVLPPPNATGVLHLGHALESSAQDAMVRYNRMRGKRTLWIPGTDHAAIATDTKMTKILSKEGLKKSDIGREKFLERVDEFVADSRSTIQEQLRRVGDSLDWSREAFTLDEKRRGAVFEAFKTLYEDGLIYRKDRIVNWDPKGQTTISDDEVVYEERKGKLFTFKYSKEMPFSIATTRPETKLGDTAVAVHPKDKRYKNLIGKEYSFEFAGHPVSIKVVADEEVDTEFGTGVVGVTPAHSQTDWEIGERHNLPVVQVINEYGKIMYGIKGVKNQKTTVAREKIVEWLNSEGLLEKVVDIDQSIGTAERTGGVIEPLPKLQWWVDVTKPAKDGKSLKEMMLEVVRDGSITIQPQQFEKIYFNWIKNLKDWNISRQIWYGHRIPVWYKINSDLYENWRKDPVGMEATVRSLMATSEPIVSFEKPEGEDWVQDFDTLDTWFSSGLWSFSTLGWPQNTDDLKNFHPTDFMNPGHEIIFFWVARMILMSTYLINEVPFKTVVLHGMLGDSQGRKFSKSLGNGIDPIEVIDEYGADSLRMALIIGVTPGQDMQFDIQKVKAYKKFGNKIWNATRFVLENLPEGYTHKTTALNEDQMRHKERLEEIAKDATDDIENYRLHLASEKLYHYFWHEFADVVLEEQKDVLNTGEDKEQAGAHWLLYEILTTTLKLLHPFMPFITEEIWQSLPIEKGTLLMVERWPI